jgi:hypothetical protein
MFTSLLQSPALYPCLHETVYDNDISASRKHIHYIVCTIKFYLFTVYFYYLAILLVNMKTMPFIRCIYYCPFFNMEALPKNLPSTFPDKHPGQENNHTANKYLQQCFAKGCFHIPVSYKRNGQ